MRVPDPVRAQTEAVLGMTRDALGDAILAAYRYGSAVVGGLRPESDLDLMGVIARPTTPDEKRALVAGLVPLSRRGLRAAGWRPVELTLVVAGEVRPWRWPPRFDFQYGEWLRAALEAGDLAPWPPVNPDVAMLVTMVRQHGEPLLGPPPTATLDPVPRSDLVRATLAELDPLQADVVSDTRNVLLTLARMWVTVATGELLAKDAAAEWAASRLSGDPGATLLRAAAAYRDGGEEDWAPWMADARATAALLSDAVRSAAAGNDT